MTFLSSWCTFADAGLNFMFKETHMTPRHTALLVIAALLFAELMISVGNAQQISGPVKADQLMGLTGIKQNAKGTLSVKSGQLHFVYGEVSSDVRATSIKDVVTSTDSQLAVGSTVHMISTAAPYGGGRFLSLFRKEIDTLTVQYRDGDGSVHGAIFTMPVGTADVIKHELVAQGTHTTVPGELNAAAAPSNTSRSKEQKQ
jgi:hypothetical protein